MIDQWSFTAPFEGKIKHLYLDTVGLVTCGVGFMLPGLTAARALPWSPRRDIELDWAEVVRLPPGKPAAFYEYHTRARLTEDAMRAEFQRRMFDLETQLLKQLFPSTWRTLPEGARIALLDMGYNLGVKGLAKYLQLRAAVARRDWHTAATECHRRGISAARNQATSDIFEKCTLTP